MKPDLLDEASRALRLETDDEDSGKFTRARIMASLHQSQVRRRTRLAFVLPLAASFAAATAWGTVSGRAPEIARNVVQALGFSIEPAAPAPAPPARPRSKRGVQPDPRAPGAVPQPPAPAAPAPSSSDAPLPAPEPSPPPAVSGDSRPRGLGNSEPKPTRAEERDPSHELYRVAHRAHFVEQNCTRALEAWAAYLEAAPKGRFAPEARYNRALCFVRTGNRNAARSALTPFARGAYGTYRQREAEALLQALGD